MNIKNFISFFFIIQSAMTFPRRNRNGRENEIKSTSSITQSMSSTTQSMSSTTQSMSSTTHTCA